MTLPMPFYEREGIRIYVGDNREVLPRLDTESVSAVVCDPPYGLSREPDVAEVLKHWLAGDDYHHSGGGFMGKTWDSFVPGPSTWKMVAATMKPGAHLLSFAGARTYDLMGMSIRLAGYEIRDTLQWLYGSGFPKSHDVSKAIDKMAGAEREVVGRRVRLGDTKDYSTTRSGGTWKGNTGLVDTGNITAPATPAAEQWQGFGTALKPSYEPVLMCRKPFKGTVAANVLAHGTGGINVDACRIGTEGETPSGSGRGQRGTVAHGDRASLPGGSVTPSAGRWPANVILDEAAAAMLDAQSGVSRSSTAGVKPRSGETNIYGGNALLSSKTKHSGTMEYGDTGGASRFFKVVAHDLPIDQDGASRFAYIPKASRRERNAGLEGMPERAAGGMQKSVKGGVRVDTRPGRVNMEMKPVAAQNHHPTVKPIALMRYLIQMVTPPGGVVLDPFMGSGSTLVAAAQLGFPAIGIELSEEYAEIAARRVDHVLNERAKRLPGLEIASD